MLCDGIRWSVVDEISSGEFEDCLGKTHRIAESVEIGDERCLSLGRAPSPMILTQARVCELLPALQTFVETGKLLPERRPFDLGVAPDRAQQLRTRVRKELACVLEEAIGGAGLMARNINCEIKTDEEDQVVREELEGLLRLVSPPK